MNQKRFLKKYQRPDLVDFSSKCPVCGKAMSIKNKYCSLECYKKDSIPEEEAKNV